MWDARGRLRVKLVGLTLTMVMDTALAHIQCQLYHNTTVSNALKIYFWGDYFLSIMEYTGNLQGKNAFKTLFF